MTAVVAFVVAAGVTFALRSAVTVAGDRMLRSPRLELVLSAAAPAVLAAMIASALFLHHGTIDVPPVADVVAVVVGAAVARRTGNAGVALLVGLPAYWVLLAAGLG